MTFVEADGLGVTRPHPRRGGPTGSYIVEFSRQWWLTGSAGVTANPTIIARAIEASRGEDMDDRRPHSRSRRSRQHPQPLRRRAHRTQSRQLEQR